MNKHEWLSSRDPAYGEKASPAKDAWACFGQWLEIVANRANGDISRVDLTLWAKWFGDGLTPSEAVERYNDPR